MATDYQHARGPPTKKCCPFDDFVYGVPARKRPLRWNMGVLATRYEAQKPVDSGVKQHVTQDGNY